MKFARTRTIVVRQWRGLAVKNFNEKVKDHYVGPHTTNERTGARTYVLRSTPGYITDHLADQFERDSRDERDGT